MKMSKFVHFRAQRDLNGAEITVTMTTERTNTPDLAQFGNTKHPQRP